MSILASGHVGAPKLKGRKSSGEEVKGEKGREWKGKGEGREGKGEKGKGRGKGNGKKIE